MSDSTSSLIRKSGAAMAVGGVMIAGVNLVLSPLVPAESTVETATSWAFLVRQPLAAITVLLLGAGAFGLYLAHGGRSRLMRGAFALAAIGGIFAFCVEIVQVTLIRDLAFAVPDTLTQLEDASQLQRYDVAFAVGAATFLLGWLISAVAALFSPVVPRRGPTIMAAGFVLVMGLGAAFGLWGAIAGNVVLGVGWTLLGIDLRRAACPLFDEGRRQREASSPCAER